MSTSYNLYLYLKAFHIIFVIFWISGLLYLPRLFVYHAKAAIGSEKDIMLQTMEKKLLRFIMNPSMIIVFILGFILLHLMGDFSHIGIWFHVKFLLVILLAAYHGFLSSARKKFANGQNRHSEKFYRIINEIPGLLVVAIVILVTVKPF